MASLVADYGDSSGESDAETDADSVSVAIPLNNQELNKGTSGNFFAAEDGAGSGSDDSKSSEDIDHGGTKEEAEVPGTPRLPNPFLQQASSKLSSPNLEPGAKKNMLYVPGPTSSVFRNPFEQAEQAKLGILEKHVRLTEAAPQKPASKQVCFKFKKGKCFLGDKCRFFHDKSNIAFGNAGDRYGDSVSPETETDCGTGFGQGDSSFVFPGSDRGVKGHAEEQFYHPVAQFSRGQPVDPRATDEDNYMFGAKGKKRHGINDTLVPPKKALMQLGDLRNQERPWTVKKKK